MIFQRGPEQVEINDENGDPFRNMNFLNDNFSSIVRIS
jgi:hypothetical protein